MKVKWLEHLHVSNISVIFSCHISVSDEGFLPDSTNQVQREIISVANTSTSIVSPATAMPTPSMNVPSGMASSLHCTNMGTSSYHVSLCFFILKWVVSYNKGDWDLIVSKGKMSKTFACKQHFKSFSHVISLFQMKVSCPFLLIRFKRKLSAFPLSACTSIV